MHMVPSDCHSYQAQNSTAYTLPVGKTTMKHFRDLDLSSYSLSSVSGFLPERPALERLPNPYYDHWEDLSRNLPQLVASDTLKDKLERLPILSTALLDSEEEWRRAYVVLSFLSQGYIWSGDQPRRNLPIAIAAPLRRVSEYLTIMPCGTFAAYCLWNVIPSPKFGNPQINPEDFISTCTFTGSKEEEWFYVISVAIEARGGRLIPKILDAIDAVKENDTPRVRSFLEAFITCVDGIILVLDRMGENLSQEFFYHRLRPYLRGGKNMAQVGLPDGIFYPLCQCEGGEGEWLAYSGGSNAQSSLIQLMDITLGTCQNVEFIKEMRNYMPGPHREFLELMTSVSNIRPYILSLGNDSDVRSLYDKAVLRLAALRDCHLRVVARYILIPAGKKNPSGHRQLQERGRGTGGTDIMKFLRETRNNTLSACCEQSKGSTVVQTYPKRCETCGSGPIDRTTLIKKATVVINEIECLREGELGLEK